MAEPRKVYTTPLSVEEVERRADNLLFTQHEGTIANALAVNEWAQPEVALSVREHLAKAASQARVIEKLKALTCEQIALHEQYVVDHAADHDDDCPGDDTCECSYKCRNDAVSAVCRYLLENRRLLAEEGLS